MILRRFMEHVSDQNWFAVGLDMLVVVCGIYVGMTVTQWSDDRARGQDEARLVALMLSDLETSKDYLDLLASQYERNHLEGRNVLSLLEGDTLAPEDVETFETGLRRIGQIMPIDSYLIAFTDSNIARIHDNEARRAVSVFLTQIQRD